ncbi:MAG: hypothetical protein ACREPW_12180 [Candidatus Binataceae bacterium]
MMTDQDRIDFADSRDAFTARLEEIAADAGGKAALARKAKLPATSLQNFFDRASEPTRPVLVALAVAAGVSVDWLASGRGEKRAGEAPEGYIYLSCYDLTTTGPYLRGMVGNPGARLLVRSSEIVGRVAVSDGVMCVVGAAELAFPPDIRPGDTIMYEQPPWHNPIRPSLVEGWELSKDLIYLVADGIALKLRKLHPQKGGSVLMIAPGGKNERTLTGAPRDFILFGSVIWRSGAVGLTL